MLEILKQIQHEYEKRERNPNIGKYEYTYIIDVLFWVDMAITFMNVPFSDEFEIAMSHLDEYGLI